ncbi:N-acetyltransferase [Aureimonas endophytica]|uniref:N-acetyltransferase n=1 Tax=Aureimonas endophytica TaxID=2027858 RepID=A0A917E1P1_9HYPH|nr:GNAT family N-acetyltransferase [Aureimonas endophytica]GGD93205.1 N-acetyltransferase [Aureimonas endophytica]
MPIEVLEQADPADLDRVLRQLTAFNAAEVGEPDRRPLAVLLRPEAGGPVTGGLVGFTAWNWLFTGQLWLAEAERGKGMAGRLLAEAEAEALRRGCHSAWIDTFNPVAKRAYEAAGYAVFGSLPRFVGERTRFFLSKALHPGP